MVKGKYLLLVLPLLFIASCGQQERPLRSDIAEFISGFSLSKSMEEYKAASYTSNFESLINGVKESEEEYVEFDCKDDSAISYTHTLKKYKDNVIVSERNETIVTEGERYIHTLDGDSEDYTKEQCVNLIRTYFYNSEPVEGFHDGGMYQGDYIIGTAVTFQDYIIIDQENKTLNREIFVDDSSQDVKIKDEMKIDELGMIIRVYNKTEKLSTQEYALREITTSKL